LTRDYNVIVPLMLATVVADIVAGSLMHDSIMTEKLTRRGLRVRTEYEVDLFRTVSARDIMTTAVETLSATATVAEARERLSAGRHGAYPIIDSERHCVGIVARGDLLRVTGDPNDPVLDHASRDVVCVAPDDLALTVLRCMLDEHIEHVPVVDNGILVGVCTRTDLMRIREQQFAHEEHQTGWRPLSSFRSNGNGGGGSTGRRPWPRARAGSRR
jgi:CIC family chloride channel protein